ncbi:hypothetical protein JTE90_018841 [Oedothorax gibbosus]|uniref:Uncharacterized protein n=1 Tax=Oedothorax gibbosus TaxID=931172 RepID=A0AAV6UY25_9ARAC|nr:hypothetical protein JTE90_018841 [Oedothorax gibbosus]
MDGRTEKGVFFRFWRENELGIPLRPLATKWEGPSMFEDYVWEWSSMECLFFLGDCPRNGKSSKWSFRHLRNVRFN